MSKYKNPVCRGSFMLGTACGRCERCMEKKDMNNTDFPISKKLGLKIWDYKDPHHHFAVDAEELEELLQSAQVVYGNDSGNESVWFSTPSKKGSDTRTALVIGITPLKKKTKAEAALELLERLAKDPVYYSSLGSAEAKRILEMKDEE